MINYINQSYNVSKSNPFFFNRKVSLLVTNIYLRVIGKEI